MVMLGAALVGLPLPVLPLQILWVNLGTRQWSLIAAVGLVVVVSAVLQVALVLVPSAQQLFHLTALTLGDGSIPVLAGLGPLTVIEIAKLVRRAASRPRRRPTA